MLILDAAMIGAFLVLDLILFYVFFELMLLPMYLIIGVWGGKNRVYAAVKFFIFIIVGSLLMFFGILYFAFLQYHHNNITTFTIIDFYGIDITPQIQALLFTTFSLTFT